MTRWMGEPEIGVEVSTTWETASPILVKGFHHGAFENKGIVLKCLPPKLLQYSQLSSVSRLPDLESNYHIVTFRLSPSGDGTQLSVHVENFPTESIYRHLEFYWRGTLVLLKDMIEGENQSYD